MPTEGQPTWLTNVVVTRPRVGLGVIDRDMRFVEVDETLAALHGVAAEAHIGRELAAILPEQLAAIEPLVRRVFATAEPITDVEIRGRGPDKRPYRWLVSYFPVRTRTGSVLAVECAVSPISTDSVTAAASASQTAGEAGAEAGGIAEANARLESLIRGAPLGIAFVDRELRFGYVNASMAELTQLPPGDHLGRTAGELLGERGRRWEEQLRQVIAGGEPLIDIELSGTREGKPCHALVSCYPVRGDDGATLGVGVLIKPMARRGDEELALLDTLIQAAPIGFALFDTDLRYQRINERLAAINGRPAADHLGRTMAEVLPGFAEVGEPLLRRVLETGEPLLDLELSEQNTVAPGEERIVRASFYPVSGGEGQVLGIGAIVTDITEYRRSAVERTRLLALSERAFARTAALQAVSAALAAVVTPDQVARVIVEQAAAALGARSGALAVADWESREVRIVHTVGYPPEIAQPWMVYPLDAPNPIADAVRQDAIVLVRSLEEAERLYPQLAGVRAALTDVAWASIPLSTDGRPVGGLSLGFDTPQTFEAEDQALLRALAQQCVQALDRARLYEEERRAREQAEAAVRVRDELTALISHDLKNPLTVVIGQAHLAQRNLQREAPDFVRLGRSMKAIQEAAAQMRSLIDDLLDLARLRTGQAIELHQRAIDLVALARAVVTSLQLLTDRHKLRVETVEPSMTCVCDEARIERVLANLVSNAIKYSPQGGDVVVSLSRRAEAAAGWVVLTVRDQGIGIPADDMERIFEQYQRAQNVTSRISGTGLGLTSARQIVEQHGGRISVSSVEGQGSLFTVELPLG